MNFNIFTYMFFRIILTSSDDKQQEINILKKSSKNPNLNTTFQNKNNANSKNNDVEEETCEKLENLNLQATNPRKIDNKENKNSSEESRDNTASSKDCCLNNENSEDTKDKISKLHMKLIETWARYVLAEICKFRGGVFEIETKQIPAVVNMDFVSKNNIPFEKICNVYELIIELVDLTTNVKILFDKFVCKEICTIKENDINRSTYNKDNLDTTTLTKCSELINNLKTEFKDVLKDINLFFRLICNKDICASSFTKFFEEYGVKIPLKISESISEIQKFGYENIDEIIRFLCEELQEKQRDLNELFSSNGSIKIN